MAIRLRIVDVDGNERIVDVQPGARIDIASGETVTLINDGDTTNVSLNRSGDDLTITTDEGEFELGSFYDASAALVFETSAGLQVVSSAGPPVSESTYSVPPSPDLPLPEDIIFGAAAGGGNRIPIRSVLLAPGSPHAGADGAGPPGVDSIEIYAGLSGGPAILSVADASAFEGAELVFVITRTGNPFSSFSVNYTAFVGPSNTAINTDFTPASGTVTFASGQLTAFVTPGIATTSDWATPPAPADAPIETISLQLTGGIQGSIVLLRSTALGNILDNNPPTANNDGGPGDPRTPAELSIIEGATSSDLVGTLLGNDNEPDVAAGDSISVVGINTTGTLGQVSLVNGVLQYTADSAAFGNLASGAVTTDTFSYTIRDQGLETSTATVTVTITGVNDAPVATAGAALLYGEGAAAAVIDNTITVSDVDTPTLTGATVRVTSGFLVNDFLAANTTGTGIAAVYDSVTGNLTLGGVDTLANYQQVLRSVTYESLSANPTNFGSNPSRTITWLLNDGADSSAPVTSTVNLTATNDAPVVGNVGGAVGFNEAPGTPVVIDADLSATDIDSANLTNATVRISTGLLSGDLLAATTAGTAISAVYSAGNGTLTLSGSDTVANYQSVLRSVTYASSNDNPTSFGANTSRTVTWQVSDGALASANVTSTVNITADNDAPTATAGAVLAYTEGSAASFVDTTVTTADVDNLNLAGARVAITGGLFTGDALAANTTGTAITASYTAGNGTLTLSGSDTLANYQTVLRTVTYSSASNNPTNFGANTNRTVSWVLDDGAGNSTPVTSTINITPVNNAPMVANAGGTVGFSEATGTPVVIDSDLSVTDIDSANLTSATVAITGGLLTGDLLAATTGGTAITASYSAGNGTLTLSGSDSQANYQSVLRSVTYASTNDNPTNFGANPSRTVSWQVSDGALASANVTSTVNVTASNDAPALDLNGAAAGIDFPDNVGGSTLFSAGPPVAIVGAGTLTVSDADSTILAGATATITNRQDGANELLAVDTTGTAITGTYSTVTGILTLSGNDTVANYQAVLRTLSYDNNAASPEKTVVRDVAITVTDGTTASTVAHSFVAINNQAPTLTAGAALGYTEGNAASVIDAGVNVADADNANLTGATVVISTGLATGDLLAATTGGTAISAVYSAGNGTLTLSGSDTIANYQSVLRSVTYASTSDNPTDFGNTNASRTITWQVNDGSGANNLSANATSTVTVTAVNDAPQMANAGNLAAFSESPGTAVVLDGDITVADIDSANLTGATVVISTGLFTGDLLAAATGGTAITANYSAGNGTLTLSGSDTLANYQSVLRSVTYDSSSANPTNFGANTGRTFTWQANDGAGANNLSANVTSTLNITPANDAPVVANAGGAVGFSEATGTPVVIDNDLSVSDIDSANLTGATVIISGGLLSGDLLAATTGGTAITASYNAGNGTLTLSGSDTQANYQSVLRSVSYDSTNLNPTNFGANASRTVTWQVSDGALASANVTSTVNVTPSNDAPVVGNVAGVVAFSEAPGTPVVIDADVSVLDPDSANLTSASVTISSGLFSGDLLTASTGGTAITALYSAGNGTLTLSGSDTVANYQSVLRSVTYASSSDNPTNFGGNTSRTVTWQVSDGALASANVTSTVNVTPDNDAPALDLNGAAAGIDFPDDVGGSTLFSAGPAIAIVGTGTLSVSDVDSANLTGASAVISNVQDGAFEVLAANTTGTAITATYTAGNATLTLTGSDTVANYQSVLRTLTYDNNAATPNKAVVRDVTVTVNDGTSSSSTAHSFIAINNQQPTITNAGNDLAYTEGNAALVLDGDISVADTDNANLTGATVVISSGLFAGDTLAATIGGTAITASYSAGNGTLTLSGSDTIATYQNVLRSVTYTSASDNPTDFGTNTARTITWQVNDGSGANNLSANATSTVTVTAVNDAPQMANAGNLAAFSESPGTAVVLDGDITVADIDSANLTGATVVISTGLFTGDLLAAATGGTAITANYSAGNGTLTLSGSDTLANYQSVLRSVTYDSSSANPTNFGANTGRTFTWQANDGAGANNLSANVTSTLNITPSNDAPVMGNAGNVAAFSEAAGTPVVLDGDITASDVDSANLSSATVVISSGLFSGDLLAATTGGTAITASFSAGNGTLTLSGSDSVANYQSVLRSVTYDSTSDNPTNFGANTGRTLTWRVADSAALASANVTSTLNVTAENDAPQIGNAGGNVTFSEAPATPVVIDSDLAVSDPDSANLTSASVTISSGLFSGDLLTASTGGTAITALYSAGNGTLTLSGSDTVANYQSVLRSVTYASSSDNPTNFGSNTSRTVTWQVSDGALASANVTSTVNVTPDNDAPALDLNGAAAGIDFPDDVGGSTLFSAGPAIAIVGTGTLSVADVDSANLTSASAVISNVQDGAFEVLAANTTGTAITATYTAGNATLTLTGSDTVANYQSVLRTLTYDNNAATPNKAVVRDVTVTVNDGTSSSTTAHSFIAINNQQPTITNAGNDLAYTEGNAALVLDGDISVADTDNANLTGATVVISSGLFAGDTLAATIGGTAITASYSAGNGTLTLSGSDTIATYQNVLRSVTYTSASDNPTDFGTNTARTITWQVNDGSGANNLSANATSTVTVTAVNDAPQMANAGNLAAFSESPGTAVVLDGDITVADIDSANLTGATVVISTGLFTGDLLAAATGGTAITANYSAGNGTLTLSGSDTLANYQSVLRSVTYDSSSANPTNFGANTGRTFTWQANDGAGANNLSANVTSTLNITPSNDAPVMGNAGNVAAFSEAAGTPVVLDGDITASDVDSANLSSATVVISSGLFSGDLLAATTGGTAITASFSAGNGTLTLSGSDSVANYQSVLRSVTYDSTSDNPTNFGANTGRTLTWRVADSAALASANVTSTLNVTAENDAPQIGNAGGNVTFSEAPATPVVIDSDLAVSDPDSANLTSASVTISSGLFSGDLLTASTGGTAITALYSAGNGTLTLSGSDTVANYQSVLRSVTYASSSDNPTNFGSNTSRTVTWQVSDGALASANVTSTVNVTPDNDAPALDLNGAAAGIDFPDDVGGSTLFSAGPAIAIVGTGTLSVADVDSANLTSASAVISNVQDGAFEVLAANTTGTAITATYTAGNATLTLTGSDTVANYQSVLRTLTYDNNAATPNKAVVRDVTVTVNDGTSSSTTAHSFIAINNQQPTITNAGNDLAYTEGNAALVLDGDISVADTDNANLTGATVVISSGLFAGDTLAATIGGTAITASYSAGNGTLTLSGSDTIATYQNVLRSVTYTSASDNPTDFGTNTARTITWQVNDGSGANNLSANATSTVTVTAVNDAPQMANAGNLAAFSESPGTAVVLDGDITVADIDSANLTGATVVISTGLFTGDLLAAATGGTAITANYSAGNGTLTLSGSDTLANYQSVLRSVTYDSSSANPTNFGANTGRTFTWQANDGAGANNLSANVTSTLNITPANDAPVVANAGGAVGFSEATGTPVVIDNDLSVSDIDSANLTGATVIISGGLLSGDLLAATTGGTAITASYNAGNGTLTLSGSDTQANYQSVLRSVSYDSTNLNPTNFGANASRTVTWQVSDGALASANVTSTVNVTPSNDAPVVGNVAGVVAFSEAPGTPVVIDADVSVLDPDSANLTSASVTISSGLFSGDLLTASTGGTAITALYSAGNGTLTLSGSDTVANYQSVLRSVTYASSSDNPTNFGSNTSRTVTWQVSDGALASANVTSTVNVTPDNDAPALDLNGAAAGIDFPDDVGGSTLFSAGPAIAIVGTGTLSVSDVDSANLTSASAVISNVQDGAFEVLAANTTGTAITATYTAGNATLTLTGSDTVANYQSVLRTLTYDNNAATPNKAVVRDVTVTVNDGTSSSTTAHSFIAINNQQPTITNAGNDLAYTEGNAALVLDGDISVADTDNANLTGATVVISSGLFAGDTLAATIGGTAITASYSAGNGTLTLSGSDTIATYQNVLRSVTYTSASDNPTDFGTNTARTITWQVNDGSGANNLSANATSTVTVTAVNDAPQMANAGNLAAFSESPGTAVVLDGDITVADIDSANLTGATVVISTGLFTGDLLAAATGGTAITANYSAGNGTLTLSGSDTLANYQSVLRSVTYDSSSANPTNFGANTGRTFTWQANDGAGANNLSANVTSTLNITPSNDAPVMGNAGNVAAFSEAAGTPVVLDGDITASDVDSANLSSATVVISSGLFSGDLLAATTGGTAITASFSAGNGTLTLSGSDSVANYQSVLRSVTYDSTSDNPTNFGANTGRTLTWRVADSAALASANVTSTLNVTAENDAPQIGNAGGNVTFSEAPATPVVIDSDLAVSDPDSANLTSASVTISSGLFSGDLLTASTGGTAITALYSAGNGTLTLSGSDTVANYQSVLRSVTYASSSDNPTNFGSNTSRTVTWQVSDGALASANVTSTVNVTPDNDAPALDLNGAAAGIDFPDDVGGSTLFSAGPAIAIVGTGTLSVADVDSANLTSASAVISNVQDGAFEVLAANTTGTAITATYTAGNATLTLTGSDTVANYQSVLRTLTYDNNAATPNKAVVRDVTVTVNDGTSSSTTAHSFIAINNQQPTITNAGNDLAYTEGNAALVLDGDISVADTDNANLTGATVVISSGLFAGDTLAATIGGTAITASYSAGNGTLTLSGSDTIATYQNVLRSVTYTSASDNPTDFGTNTARTITWQVNDGSGANNLSANATSTVTVTAVNDAPQMANAGNLAAFSESPGTAVVLDGDITVADIDSANLTGATVVISTGLFTGDLLAAATGGTAITANYSAGNGTLTLSGSDTLANYQSVLRSVTYDSSSANPTNFGANTGRTFTWQANDGAGANNLSANVTSTLNITPANDAPVVANAGGAVGFSEATGTPVVIDNDLSVSDIDSANLTGATVIISGGLLSGDLLAATTGGTAITASYNAGNGTLTLSGSDTQANYQSVLRSVSYDSTNLNPTNFGANASRTVTWQVSDGALASANVTSTVNVTPSNDAPVVGNVAGVVAFSEAPGTPVVIDADVSVLDPDSANLTSASVTISSGLFSGDLLTASTGGTAITALYSAGNGTLTLSGSDTVANYQSVLRSVTYASSSDNPTNFGSNTSRTVTWQVSDGALASANVTSTVNVTPDNDAPALDLNGAAAGIDFPDDVGGSTLFSAGPAIAIVGTGTLSVSDVDSANLTGATAIISNAQDGAVELLAVDTTGTAITALYTAGNHTLALSGSDTVANYQSVLRTLTYDNNAASPEKTVTRDVTVTVTDGTSSSTAAHSFIAINNQAPTLTAGAALGYTEGNAASVIDAGVNVADADNANLTGATVVISTGLATGDLLAATTGGTAISAVYSAGNGTLTLSGSDSVANYQSVLRSVTYASTSDNPTDFGNTNASRTVTWQVNDGSGANNLSANATSTVNLTPLNDAPTATAGGNLAYTEGNAASVIDGNVTAMDADNANLASATVTISGGLFTGDLLAAATGGTNISAAYSAGNGTLTLSGSDTVANYQNVLRSVTYSSSSVNPTNFGGNTSRTISWELNDGAVPSSTVTSTVNVTAVNNAPQVDLNGGAAGTGFSQTFVAGNGAVAIVDAGNLTVMDQDHLNLSTATVTITNRLDGANEILAATGTGNITANYNSGAGILTLSGSDTLANYQQVLRSLTYNNVSGNPDKSAARSITVVVNDGTTPSSAATANVTIANQAPNVVAGGNLAYTEGNAATVINNGITITDTDNTMLTGATVIITAGLLTGDSLAAATGGTSITANYSAGNGTLTLSGADTLTNYQTVLRSVTYASSSLDPTVADTNTSRTVSWQVDDGSTANNLSGIATSTVNLSAVNTAPVNTVPLVTQNVASGGSLVFSGGNAVSVSDVDAGSSTVRVTLTATGGNLTLGNLTGLSFVSGDGTNDTSMVFTGNLTEVASALTNLRYNATTAGSQTITITTNDQSNTGSGGNLTDTDVINVTVTSGSSAGPIVQLATLNGTAGIKFNGITGESSSSAGDNAGRDIAALGDVNSDGYADFMIGAGAAEPSGGNGGTGASDNRGEAYILFGGTNMVAGLPGGGTTNGFNLADLDGTNGVLLTGRTQLVQLGTSLGGAGDVNGDGRNDIIITEGQNNTNDSYLMLGTTPTIFNNLHDETVRGFEVVAARFDGTLVGANFDSAIATISTPQVSGIGDVDGDGRADLMIGHAVIDGSLRGETLLVFGDAATTLDGLGPLSTNTGSSVLQLLGAGAFDFFGRVVTGIGDINRDGYADFAIGSANSVGSQTGTTYVFFGDKRSDLDTLASNIFNGNGTVPNVNALNGANGGFRLGNSLPGGNSIDPGTAITAIGDFNGDGYGDYAIGGQGTPASRSTVHVLFGKAGGFTNLDLHDSLLGAGNANGFLIVGRAGMQIGSGISGGDVNGDGYDDILIGAKGSGTGNAYVIFGRPNVDPLLSNLSGFGDVIQLGDDTDFADDSTVNFSSGLLASGAGLTLLGPNVSFAAGATVSVLGDVNGDGFADMLIGAPSASNPTSDGGGSFSPGQIYLVYGSAFITATASSKTAASAGESLVAGGATGVTLSSGTHGTVALRGGAGDDTLLINFNERWVDGGLDTSLKATSPGVGDTLGIAAGVADGLALDFTALLDGTDPSGPRKSNLHHNIERINVEGNGNNIVSLDPRDVLQMTGPAHKLFVFGDAGDVVQDSVPGSGSGTWTSAGLELIDSVNWQKYTDPLGSSAILYVEPELTQTGLI